LDQTKKRQLIKTLPLTRGSLRLCASASDTPLFCVIIGVTIGQITPP